jgi:4'-phosphopantetheinyl transferase
VAGRGFLRMILSRYIGVRPTRLQFCYGPQGKPALAGSDGMGGLRFNVSHSHGLALYAVTRSREIGVDLEAIRLDLDVERIAERCFSSRERSVLAALPAHLRAQAFFACWTRKEAFVKAKGSGSRSISI